MTWQRLHGMSLEDEGLGEPGDPPSENLLAHRLYGPDGKKWPRLSITIRKSFSAPEWRGFHVCVSYRHSNRHGWDSYEAYVPYELAGELQEMIAEVASAAKTKGGDS